MSSKLKLQCFEYLVHKILEWDMHNCGGAYRYSLTKLKLQKLLFLVAASQASNENHYLLSVFNNFYAMGNGPVESDVYNAMLNNKFRSIYFSGRIMSVAEASPQESLESRYKFMVDSAFDFLLKQNPEIIKYNASRLVEITHKWYAWQAAISIADALGKGSVKMKMEDICSNTKFYR